MALRWMPWVSGAITLTESPQELLNLMLLRVAGALNLWNVCSGVLNYFSTLNSIS